MVSRKATQSESTLSWQRRESAKSQIYDDDKRGRSTPSMIPPLLKIQDNIETASYDYDFVGIAGSESLGAQPPQRAETERPTAAKSKQRSKRIHIIVVFILLSFLTSAAHVIDWHSGYRVNFESQTTNEPKSTIGGEAYFENDIISISNDHIDRGESFENSPAPATGYCKAGDRLYLSLNPDVQKAVKAGKFGSGFEHWVKDGNREGRKYTCKSPRDHWIDVVAYAEGIGGWRTSLMELLQLAQALSATLVEPCMRNGRLGSCGSDFDVPVSEVFDFSQAMESSDGRPPLLASYDDYQRHLSQSGERLSRHEICVTVPLERCGSMNVTRVDKVNGATIIEDLLNSERITVLQLSVYWWGNSIKKLEKLLKIGSARSNIKQEQLIFHPRHVQTVEDVLRRANITNNNFSIIHWRAERQGMDFDGCAKAVLDAKYSMINRFDHPFVLMTSLNENPDMMWGGSKRIATKSGNSSKQALDFLVRDNGFLKFDGLLKGTDHKIQDPGILAIYDLILASKAKNFASCARHGKVGCDSNHTRNICEKCNHIGKFGALAVTLRKQLSHPRNSTWECWPQK